VGREDKDLRNGEENIIESGMNQSNDDEKESIS